MESMPARVHTYKEILKQTSAYHFSSFFCIRKRQDRSILVIGSINKITLLL